MTETNAHSALRRGTNIYGTITLCALTLITVSPLASAQSLDDAFRVELSRLDAEKSAIQGALTESQTRGTQQEAKLVSEIEALARRLTQLRADNAQSELQLPQAERLQSLEGQTRNLERRQRQIETWLENHGVTPPTGSKQSGEGVGHQHPPIDGMVEAALRHVEEHGKLWVRSNQEYFGDDGVAEVGAVLHIAEVGAVVVDGFRPLDLASDGSLRLAPQHESPSQTFGIARSVHTVLFDPDDIRPVMAKEDGWRSWFKRGGGVMWAIAALALLGVLVFCERVIAYVLFFIRLNGLAREGIGANIPPNDPLLKPISVIQNGSGNIEKLESEAADAIHLLRPYVHRGVSLLAVVASVAPLLGLLGTVTGMIGTFAVITEHGTGDPRLLSGGISEALLTTQFGLMVAIPALLFKTTLYRLADSILRRIETICLASLEGHLEGKEGKAGAEPDGVSDKIVAVRSLN